MLAERLRHSSPPEIDLSTPEAAAVALRVFFRISSEWKLTPAEEQVLLGVGKTTLFAWRAGKVKAGLDATTIERLSHIFGIYKSLQMLLPVPERANAWIRSRNTSTIFGGDTALRRLMGGQFTDLIAVHSYLDAARGGDFS